MTIQADIPTDAIASRAFEIWEREGRPHGQDKLHWQMALRELTPRPKKAKAAPKAKKEAPKAKKATPKAAPKVTTKASPKGSAKLTNGRAKSTTK